MAITKVSRNLLNTGVSDSSDATAITIDSSENVLVGATSYNNDNAGVGLGSSGFLYATRDGSLAASFKRLTSTGSIADFRKDSSTIASVTSDGICFGSDTAAANALDDYEEGTYTPTSGASLTVSYANYTKIGRLVFLNADITVGSTSGSSAFAITLPFDGVDNYYSGLVQYNNVPEPQLAAYISTTALYFRKLDTSFASLTYTGVSGHRFIFSIVYTSAT